MKKTVARSYSYSVYYEAAPEGGYVAFIPALPGCHTQGDTLEEAEKNAKEAIEVYLESLAAHCEPIPEETKSFHGRVTVQIGMSHARRHPGGSREKCQRSDRSLSGELGRSL